VYVRGSEGVKVETQVSASLNNKQRGTTAEDTWAECHAAQGCCVCAVCGVIVCACVAVVLRKIPMIEINRDR